MYIHVPDSCVCCILTPSSSSYSLPRNNDPAYRPSFSSVCEYLNFSDSDLLELPRELPPSISSRATQLGAPLAEAKGLYLDLQYCYDESVV